MNGLNTGKQGQVYYQGRLNHPNLFSTRTIEEICCIRQAIGIIRGKMLNKKKSLSSRVYFINPVSEQVGLIHGVNWDTYDSYPLSGVQKANRQH